MQGARLWTRMGKFRHNITLAQPRYHRFLQGEDPSISHLSRNDRARDCISFAACPARLKKCLSNYMQLRLSNYGPATMAQQPTLVSFQQPRLSNYSSATNTPFALATPFQQPWLSNHHPVSFRNQGLHLRASKQNSIVIDPRKQSSIS